MTAICLQESGLMNEYLISPVDTDGLVLSHQGINSYSVDYASMCVQLILR